MQILLIVLLVICAGVAFNAMVDYQPYETGNTLGACIVVGIISAALLVLI